MFNACFLYLAEIAVKGEEGANAPEAGIATEVLPHIQQQPTPMGVIPGVPAPQGLMPGPAGMPVMMRPAFPMAMGPGMGQFGKIVCMSSESCVQLFTDKAIIWQHSISLSQWRVAIIWYR